MDTIRFRRAEWLILIAVIILIIVIAIQAINAKKEANTSESKISILSKKWNRLVEQIKAEMKSLQLTHEMQLRLEQKIMTYLITIKIILVAVFSAMVALFYLNGTDIVTSLINAVGIFSTVFFGGSFLVLTKFIDPNTVIESFTKWVRKVVYKKYAFNPELIPALKESIERKKIEVNAIGSILQYAPIEVHINPPVGMIE